MRFLKYLLFLIFLIVIGVAAIGAFLPSSTHVERRILIEQKPELIFSQINNLKKFSEWSPWTAKDPQLELEFKGPELGEGSTMLWHSEDPNVGSGSQTIIESVPYERVRTKLDFTAMGYATSYFQLEPSDAVTSVTWGMDVEHGGNLMSRYMGLLMDKWVGMDFDLGLQNLKQRAESLPGIETREVTYEFDGQPLKGYLVVPAAGNQLPGVLVVHEWWGHNQYARRRAEMLAELGYAAFALDMYGVGKVTEHPKDANAFMMEVVGNADILQGRFNAALELFSQLPETNPEQIAAIGYCFGGAVVLGMARSGAPLAGVASFHGALGNLPPLTEEGEESAYLVLNGAADPMVPEEAKNQFIESMQSVDDFEFVDYPDAQHAFTNPAATAKGREYGLPLEYDAQADEDSWQRLEAFLDRIFNQQ